MSNEIKNSSPPPPSVLVPISAPPAEKKQAPAPGKKVQAETPPAPKPALPGQSTANSQTPVPKEVKTVGEIVKDLDSKEDPINQAWASLTTAQIAQFATTG